MLQRRLVPFQIGKRLFPFLKGAMHRHGIDRIEAGFHRWGLVIRAESVWSQHGADFAGPKRKMQMIFFESQSVSIRRLPELHAPYRALTQGETSEPRALQAKPGLNPGALARL